MNQQMNTILFSAWRLQGGCYGHHALKNARKIFFFFIGTVPDIPMMERPMNIWIETEEGKPGFIL